MLGRKHSRTNHYRKPAIKRDHHPSNLKRMFFKAAAGLAVLCIMSTGFVLIYDFITQCDYFKAKSLTITGNHMFSDKEIISQADLRKGVNIFSINLSIVEKRLLAHPWIDEADISRELPSGMNIRIKEHTAVAIVDFGRRFLINNKGKIFKEFSVGDPGILPIIKGLRYSDISITPKKRSHGSGKGNMALYMKERSNPFDAVMDVLRLGQRAESVLPNKLIRKIMVDREIGITIYAFNKIKEIKLGYKNYADKYVLLKKVLLYIKNLNNLQDPVSIDLNNFNRVVVNLAR
ncbi:MAG: FtsQ-type POTRA domain-containing protein [Thermodesulfobacteriota bacterium]|nr:FtsQ-type POTRA domain-containing protein [Thermodesulfobacteriota bacterium]